MLTFQDNGARLHNPGRGWVLYYYANSLKYYKQDIDNYSDEMLLSLPCRVVYFRIAWSLLEPSRGVFNWGLIEAPLERFRRLGFRFALRVTASENQPDQPYATPRWVFDLGARGHRFDPGHPGRPNSVAGRNMEPDFGDPVFLRELERFLQAYAARFDGTQDLEFVDVGSFGVYGEGHTVSSTQQAYSADVVLRHVELHRRYFTRTLLVANHNFADRDPSTGRDLALVRDCALRGLAFRDDSILISGGHRAYYDHAMAADFFPARPIILETGEYSSRQQQELWSDSALEQAVLHYRASFLGAYWHPVPYFRLHAALAERIDRRLGYRLYFEQVKIAGDDWNSSGCGSVQALVVNQGVAPPTFPVEIVASLLHNTQELELAAVPLTFVDSEHGSAQRQQQVELRWQVPPCLAAGMATLCLKIRVKDGRALELPHDGVLPHGLLPIGAVQL